VWKNSPFIRLAQNYNTIDWHQWCSLVVRSSLYVCVGDEPVKVHRDTKESFGGKLQTRNSVFFKDNGSQVVVFSMQ
jgi:hypothetical protein